MTYLDKLIEAVEAGLAEPSHFNAVFNKNSAHWVNGQNAELADNGSLDAAKALHEALLPGWGWEAGINSTFGSVSQVWKSGRDRAYSATDATPARAFLLAVLKAYRSQQ